MTLRRGHRAPRSILLALLSALTAYSGGTGRCDDAQPLVTAPLVDRIGRAASDLAKRGRRAEADVLIDVAARLQAPAATVTTLRDSVAKALAKAKPAPLPIPDVAKTIAKIAADLAATLPTREADAKVTLARQTLRLDGANADAHAAAGDVQSADGWFPARVAALLPRRGELQTALAAAHKLDVVVTSAAPDPIVARVSGEAGVAVACGATTFASAAMSEARLTRQLREVVRAKALVNWMLTGKLEAPHPHARETLLVFGNHADYLRSLDEAAAAHLMSPEWAEAGRRLKAQQEGPVRVLEADGESAVGAWAVLDALRDQFFARGAKGSIPLRAGMTNWICARFLGCPMPPIAWTETTGDRGGTSAPSVDDAERKAMLRLSRAGGAGLRAWLRWLAARGEDPAWSRSMVDQIGKVGGDDLAKCTFVVEYVVETGELAKLVRERGDETVGAAGYEKSLGMPLHAFEERWREWLLAGDSQGGLVQLLSGPSVDPVPAGARACLAHLDDVRRRTLGKEAPAVGFDRELSDGCRAHALYLAKNSAQMSAWPDAHEEYADRDGFSAEGGRAGLSSVIAPSASSPEAAIDGWMGTFYHRVPLLAPGLLRIGTALEGGVAVLDATSLVVPPDRRAWVAWPPAGGKDVPRSFRAEMPNPVPGEDQSHWGYPTTLQFFGFASTSGVQVRLHAGPSRTGAEVPCHFSTPDVPTNPQLVPSDAFCLIPKQTLTPNSTYTVAVDGWPPDAKGQDWTFTTGTK